MFVRSYFIQVLLSEVPRHYRSCLLSQGNISRPTLCLVQIELKLRRFRKPTFIGLKSGASCKYLTSISRVFHKSLFIGMNCRCRLHLKLKELLHYCCLSLVASMGTTIEHYRSGIGCHNNFVKAKDNFSCVRGRFWNVMFYFNVFSLPTLKDVVGHYKLWNEVRVASISRAFHEYFTSHYLSA